jgi:isoleucyl-tRNA synthetase
MALARETVRLGLGARGRAKIKVRQPLAEAIVVADQRERAAIERLAEIVREELNVKRVRFVGAADELGSYEVKANYRTLGPLFGRDMPLVADAIAALEPARVAAALRGAGSPGEGDRGGGNGRGGEHDSGERRGGERGGGERGGQRDVGERDVGEHDGGPAAIGITVGGREHVLSPEDVILTLRAPEGYSVEREGAHAVALDLTISEELREEGYAREIVHAVQNARKAAGLAVEDRIELALDGDLALLQAAEAHRDYLAAETLAVTLELGHDGIEAAASDHTQGTTIDGRELKITLRRVVNGERGRG